MENNKIKVALIYPPHKVEGLLCSLAYLSNHVKPLGNVKVINCPEKGYNMEDLKEELLGFRPDIIGVSVPFVNMLKTAIEVLQCCRQIFPESWLVSGGAYATMSPEDLFNKCDFVVLGDGEYVLAEMIRSFPDKCKIEKMSGIVFMKDDRMVSNYRDAKWYKNRVMGSPDWTGIDLRKYFLTLIYDTRRKAMPIFTSKGCFYNCSYCSNGIISDRKIIYRNLDDVIKEMRFIIKRYNLNSFLIGDEIFTANEERVEEFCDKLAKERLDITWGFQTRANLVKNKNIFVRMRQVGAVVASIGIESGSNEILRINKNSNRQMIKHAVDIFKELGYIVYAGFIIGFPQDTIETVWQTITFPDELDIDSPGFQIMVPYPKTEVRRIAQKEGGILTNDFDKYSTYNVVYIPFGLKGYDLLAIRQFAFRYFHTRSRIRLQRWLNRIRDYDNFDEISKTYEEIFLKRDTLNLDYLKSLKLIERGKLTVTPSRFPI